MRNSLERDCAAASPSAHPPPRLCLGGAQTASERFKGFQLLLARRAEGRNTRC
jgi:hypothetical protein